MPAILIIDDEHGIRQTLASILEDEKYKVFTAEDALAGIEILKKEKIDMVFLDVLLPKLGGIEALERIKKDISSPEIVMISGHANIDMAVRAVKLGAFDFLEKPLSLEKVLTVCRNAVAIKKLREENRNLKKLSSAACENIIGTSAVMRNIRETVKQAAASDARILITGENGTGKEVIARAVHQCSGRADMAFIDVNCAAIPENLIESELFGHEKGAFTGALSDRKGYFEEANNGTIFLDEIGELPLSTQVRLLRVLETGEFIKVGSSKVLKTNVRIIAATNVNVLQAIDEGKFREDLYYRLNIVPISINSLHERPEDIHLLFRKFARDFAEKYRMPPIHLTDDARIVLTNYLWPGNVRQLKNVTEQISIIEHNREISAEILRTYLPDNIRKNLPAIMSKEQENTPRKRIGFNVNSNHDEL